MNDPVNTISILIVEDDLTFSLMIKTWLTKKGFDVSSASSVTLAKKHLNNNRVDLILSDLRLPDQEGIDLLHWIKEKELPVPFIIMTGYADIQSAVSAMKSGAYDFIEKPFNPDELLKKISEALNNKTGKTQKTTKISGNTHLEGESEAARQLYNYVRLVAPTTMSVLINGSSGTGKEYIAQRIHQLSNRNEKAFIAIDCGAIPKELAASEFFGHKKGSFTGALSDKKGAFLEADGGTVFLDEIGNLGYEIQIQLLRALQERKIRPVGSNHEIEIDIRLIAATNENLEQAIEKGNFREDLYHRINEFTLVVPDLKDRREDIALFAGFFLDKANIDLNKSIKGFDKEALTAIRMYDWPGNLRQLNNMIKRATLLATTDLITVNDLGTELSAIRDRSISVALKNEKTEKEYILSALRQSGNNKTKAAQLLNIDRKTLYNKLKLYGIEC